MFSQVTPTLPDPNHFASIGWTLVSLFALCGGAYYVMQMVDRIRGKEPNPPNEQLNQAQSAMSDRMTKVEYQIVDIWNTMRSEDTAIRQQLGKAISDFEGSIGQLDGTLKQVNQTMQLMLQNELAQAQKH